MQNNGLSARICVRHGLNEQQFMRQLFTVQRGMCELMRLRCERDDCLRQVCEGARTHSTPFMQRRALVQVGTEHDELLVHDPRPFLLDESDMLNFGYPFPTLDKFANGVGVDTYATDCDASASCSTTDDANEEPAILWPVYRRPSARSPVYAIDCEMCTTEAAPMQLTRISVVGQSNSARTHTQAHRWTHRCELCSTHSCVHHHASRTT
jgi:hypothetical protein